MKKMSTPIARHTNLVVNQLADELLIYDLKEDKAFCLNHTTSFIWNQCDGYKPISEIQKLLEKEYKTQIDETVIWYALQELEQKHLLESSLIIPKQFQQISRRQLVRSMGIAAAVAIPMIFAITAPSNVQAASCGGFGDPCTSDPECCPGLFCAGTCDCVLYDTPISTADGDFVLAKDVYEGQMLLGVNCVNGETIASRVKEVKPGFTNKIYSVISETGEAIQCTSSHRLMAGFGDIDGKRTETLKEGDPLLILDKDSNKIVESKLASIEKIQIHQPVIIFEMDTREHTFVSSEIVSHNK